MLDVQRGPKHLTQPLAKSVMNLWLVVPAKPFTQGKSRLAGVLQGDERAQLAHDLFVNVLNVAKASNIFTGILVISRGFDVLTLAQKHGVQTIAEKRSGLNTALTQARETAVQMGADAILVLPADLPLITTQDLKRLHALGTSQHGMVIVPSQDGGTNALLLRPPKAIEFAFGIHSFKQHCQLAKMAHVPYQVLESETLAFDVDRPHDLKMLKR